MNIEAAMLAIARVAIIIGLTWAVTFDVRYRVIPNAATLLVAGGGLLVLLMTTPGSAWVSVLAAGLVLLAFLPFAWRDSMGGGDIKLIAAATLTEPIHGVVPLLLDIAVAGGILACVFVFGGLIFRRNGDSLHNGEHRNHGQHRDQRVRSLLGRFFGHRPTRLVLRASMPYAAAVLAGIMWRMMTEAP
jgi:prepilin peptidase CpaA